MNASETTGSSDEGAISDLYRKLLASWDQQNGSEYASHFTENGNVVGFDGSQINGRSTIQSEISRIFANHKTPKYVAQVKEVRFLAPEIALLRAVAGMIPPGRDDIEPGLNAIQTMVAVKADDQWRIAHFQNTPAQFHGRPELADALTKELRKLL